MICCFRRFIFLMLFIQLSGTIFTQDMDMLYNSNFGITDDTSKGSSSDLKNLCTTIQPKNFKAPVQYDYLLAFYDPCFQDSIEKIWNSENGYRIWLDAEFDGEKFIWRTSKKEVTEFPCGTNSTNLSYINKNRSSKEMDINKIGLYLEFYTNVSPYAGQLYAGDKDNHYMVFCRDKNYNYPESLQQIFINCNDPISFVSRLAEEQNSTNPMCLKMESTRNSKVQTSQFDEITFKWTTKSKTSQLMNLSSYMKNSHHYFTHLETKKLSNDSKISSTKKTLTTTSLLSSSLPQSPTTVATISIAKTTSTSETEKITTSTKVESHEEEKSSTVELQDPILTTTKTTARTTTTTATAITKAFTIKRTTDAITTKTTQINTIITTRDIRLAHGSTVSDIQTVSSTLSELSINVSNKEFHTSATQERLTSSLPVQICASLSPIGMRI
jgi:hypothetical protein